MSKIVVRDSLEQVNPVDVNGVTMYSTSEGVLYPENLVIDRSKIVFGQKFIDNDGDLGVILGSPDTEGVFNVAFSKNTERTFVQDLNDIQYFI